MKRKSILLFSIVIIPIAIIIVFYFILNYRSFNVRILAFIKGATYLGEENVIFQEDFNDCGVACLEMILRHHNIPIKHDKISQGMNKKSGMNMLQIKQVLEDKGLRSEGWRLSFDDLEQADLPLIAKVGKSHYVVITNIDYKGSIVVLDPSIGKLKYSRKKFNKIWRGEVLIMRQANTGGIRKGDNHEDN